MTHDTLLKDYQIKDIRALRDKYPILRSFMDNEIAAAVAMYSNMFHASGWQLEDTTDFVNWATTSPLDVLKYSKV